MLIKNARDIAQIKKGGAILGAILEEVAAAAQPGVTTAALDALAERRIHEMGGCPAFKGYKAGGGRPFPATLCTSVNDEVVHGIPGERVLQTGDVIGLDIGMAWPITHGERGYFTDTALTVPIGIVRQEDERLMRHTQEALYRGIAAAQPGNTIADIGRAVEEYIRPFGFGIVLALVGHGVGYTVHEDPQIPNVWQKRNESIRIEPGMVLAIEPMITGGSHEVFTAKDGWTIRTADGSRSAHFEHTIVVEEQGVSIVTHRPSEKHDAYIPL